jgi:hypothetical protein
LDRIVGANKKLSSVHLLILTDNLTEINAAALPSGRGFMTAKHWCGLVRNVDGVEVKDIGHYPRLERSDWVPVRGLRS